MDKETQAQMDRLEQEIWNEEKDLADILADDVLKDLDELLEEAAAQSDSQQPREEPVAPEAKTEERLNAFDDYEDDEDYEDYEVNHYKEREDRLTIGLLITSCVLCMGIIGVMIYWLETFLK